jgi:hypothetical protein
MLDFNVITAAANVLYHNPHGLQPVFFRAFAEQQICEE